MKRKILFLITAICCIATLTACGKEEVPNTDNDAVVESTETIETTEDVQEPTVEETPEQEESVDVEEEIVGDVDIVAGELTMDDMQEMVVGLDIPVNVVDEGSDESFKDFTLLFPSSAYITDYTESGLRANLESIDFVIGSTSTQVDTPSNNIREDRGETQETIGKYVLERNPGRNNELGYQITYFVYDTSNDTVLSFVLTINKKSDYQEYCDALVEEFAPAFEETLRNNLQ